MHIFKKKKNRANGVAQVVECLPHKHEKLSSNPNTTIKGEKKKEKTGTGGDAQAVERFPSKCEKLSSNI
jgi:hypothetical protein